jgi:K+-transporting ATPase ATPase A chain
VGVGLTGMIMFVLLTVFLSGLMVGKTPEYLGKKIEKNEMQWVMVSILLPGLLILLATTICIFMKEEIKNIGNTGPHGLTEVLYTFSSAALNNGSAFAGFNANTPGYNIILGILMILGRLAVILPALAIGGLLVKKKTTPITSGTLATSSFIFAFMLIGTIVIVGGLTHFPALTVGPILENALMEEGKLF